MDLTEIQKLKQGVRSEEQKKQDEAAQAAQALQAKKDKLAAAVFKKAYKGPIKKALGDIVTAPSLITDVQYPEPGVNPVKASAWVFVPGHVPILVIAIWGTPMYAPDGIDPQTQKPKQKFLNKYDPKGTQVHVSAFNYWREASTESYGTRDFLGGRAQRPVPPCFGREASYNTVCYETDDLAKCLIAAETHYKQLQSLTHGYPPPHKLSKGEGGKDGQIGLGKDCRKAGDYLLGPDELWLAQQLWPEPGPRPFIVHLAVEVYANHEAAAQHAVVTQIGRGEVLSAEVRK